MTRQTWVAFVAALVFVSLAAAMVLVPVPFVAWSPGDTHNTLQTEPQMIKISGAPTYPTTGNLDLVTVSETSADSRLTLPQAIFAYWRSHHDVLPRESVYPPGKTAGEVEGESVEMMTSAQGDAVVAGLREAGVPVKPMPVVAGVTVGGPAHKILKPGDLFVTIDGQPAKKVADVGKLISRHKAGETVAVTVLRDRKQTVRLKVPVVANTQRPKDVMVGITVSTGFSYGPDISFDLGQKIGGPSAGLMFSLAIYDRLTPGSLVGDRHIAGTGTITPSGEVGAIGGIQEKIGAAEKSGATVFLVPEVNCADLAGLDTDLNLIRVEKLAGAVTAIKALNDPTGSNRTPRC